MSKTRFSSRFKQLRERAGLSARALSLAAGLGPAYVHNIELGRWVPRPEALRLLCQALGVGVDAERELRSLAGIDPDPGATPEAKAARRKAWPALLFILANDILLPRLELLGFLDRRDADAALLGAAAGAADAPSFVRSIGEHTTAPASLGRTLERFFGKLPANLTKMYFGDLFGFDFREVPGTSVVYHDLNHRVHLLAPLVGQASTLHELFDFVENFSFDRNFAVIFFPHLYWHACRCWPFDKVALPLGLRPPAQQHRLYDAVRGGMSLPDLDATLLGNGDIGKTVVESGPARPSLDDIPELPGTVGFEIEGGPTREKYYSFHGPTPPHDLVFDHLDRCEFLNRFPLLKIARPHFVRLANSLDLASWHLWKELLQLHCRYIPAAAAPFGGSKCENVVSGEPIPEPTRSGLTIQQLAAAFSAEVQSFASEGRWNAVGDAAEILDVAPEWRRIIQTLAARERAPVSEPAPKAP
jgi:transcriptional regulator with XRE-family HTH domain